MRLPVSGTGRQPGRACAAARSRVPGEIAGQAETAATEAQVGRGHRKVNDQASTSSLAPLRLRADALLNREIAFIHNSSFSRPGAAARILRDSEDERQPVVSEPTPPAGIPAYFAALYAAPLLSAARERHLFRKLNFLKFSANARRSKLDRQRPDQERVEEIERLLDQAGRVRNELAQANLRLVVSIARRLTDSCNSFEDLMSDGNLALLRAVEKFDYARGFRFSTYATHVVRRDLFRQGQRRRDEGRRTITGVGEWLLAAPAAGDDDARACETFDQWQRLRELMQRELDDRERRVLAARIGFDLASGRQTLEAIGKQLGVSKERVRQLECRAMLRLQRAVTEDDPIGFPVNGVTGQWETEERENPD